MTQTSSEIKTVTEFTISIPKPGIRKLPFDIAIINVNLSRGQIIEIDGIDFEVQFVRVEDGKINISLKHE